MIDFHTHILPGIDDGSQNDRMTHDMLCEERCQGVQCIVATPHFYADRMSVDHFLERRERAFARTGEILEEILAQSPDLSIDTSAGRELIIIPGAEVYYFRGIGGAKKIAGLCIGQTRTLLLEMPFRQWDSQTVRDVEELITKQKLHIVIAHLERYHPFQKDLQNWNEIMDLPVDVQLNTGSFLRKDGIFRRDRQKAFCIRRVQADPHILIGSDCHNMTDRSPNLAAGRQAIAAQFGESALRSIDETILKTLAT